MQLLTNGVDLQYSQQFHSSRTLQPCCQTDVRRNSRTSEAGETTAGFPVFRNICSLEEGDDSKLRH